MDELPQRSSSVTTTALIALVAAALVYRIVSTLFLHPLSAIPGPKYAAITHYYQFYYDVIKRGRFPWKLKQLHATYGTSWIL
jgi:hypothetical protein